MISGAPGIASGMRAFALRPAPELSIIRQLQK
jgi:hypothetical protein